MTNNGARDVSARPVAQAIQRCHVDVVMIDDARASANCGQFLVLRKLAVSHRIIKMSCIITAGTLANLHVTLRGSQLWCTIFNDRRGPPRLTEYVAALCVCCSADLVPRPLGCARVCVWDVQCLPNVCHSLMCGCCSRAFSGARCSPTDVCRHSFVMQRVCQFGGRQAWSSWRCVCQYSRVVASVLLTLAPRPLHCCSATGACAA